MTRSPRLTDRGTWLFQYKTDARLTRQLIRAPIVGSDLERIVTRSFGASIQVVPPRRRAVVDALLGRPAAGRAEAYPAEHITHGLLILREHLDKILAGTKTWEIRGKATARRGPVALIESKSGHVVGTCEITDVVGPLALATLQNSARRTGFRPAHLPYATTYAWVLRNARRLPSRIPYRHPPGAVIWVLLESSVRRQLRRAGAAASS